MSAASLSQLVERCRGAKEQLLGAQAPDSASITLLGAGSKLVGGARTVQVTREEVERVIVDGFFPAVASHERPGRPRGAIVEFGLPYATDAAVTRHIAAFLSRFAAQSRKALGVGSADESEASGASAAAAGHAAAGENDASSVSNDDALPVPDTLLLNGGVFRAEALTQRLANTLGAWRGAPLNVLHNDNPDVAVARGAVAYSLARAGNAPKIGGGSPRSYFLVLDDAADGKPDAESAPRGICLLPRGTEEGHEILIADRTFALRLGHPVRFHLVSSSADTVYRAGELTDLAGGDFVRLPPLATVVQPRGERSARETAVRIATSLTEVGTLDVHCIELDDPAQRWLLEFQLRRDRRASESAGRRRAGATPGARRRHRADRPLLRLALAKRRPQRSQTAALATRTPARAARELEQRAAARTVRRLRMQTRRLLTTQVQLVLVDGFQTRASSMICSMVQRLAAPSQRGWRDVDACARNTPPSGGAWRRPAFDTGLDAGNTNDRAAWMAAGRSSTQPPEG